ncbi:MAG: hypothetical protein AAF288_05805 [Planctomycetota bacterium]
MAMGVRWVCSHCRRTVDAWDDGNPYFLDQNGRKQHFYHPTRLEDLPGVGPDTVFGNDSDALCLDCGHDFCIDSEKPIDACPKCGESDLADTWELNGKRCPWCKRGRFVEDPEVRMIS